MHSGAGRFTIVEMRTMSWQELGFSSGKISLAKLFEGEKIEIDDEPTDLDFIIEKLVIGGFPTLLNKTVEQATDLNRAYAPNRLMILEDQPAWNTHIRSSHALRKSPKRHFTDVSLAVAALGADENSLINDLNFTGFLFESLVTHELRVYAQANDAKVYHYRDSSGLEVDSIVQKYNGNWCAFEIKLGTGQIDEAAATLNKFVSNLDTQRIKPPESINIITGTGISYTRPDGINVISLASLGK
jgi:hypothetical protein